MCPPTSQANQGFARTDAVCPLNRHPEQLQTSGLPNWRTCNSTSSRASIPQSEAAKIGFLFLS